MPEGAHEDFPACGRIPEGDVIDSANTRGLAWVGAKFDVYFMNRAIMGSRKAMWRLTLRRYHGVP